MPGWKWLLGATVVGVGAYLYFGRSSSGVRAPTAAPAPDPNATAMPFTQGLAEAEALVLRAEAARMQLDVASSTPARIPRDALAVADRNVAQARELRATLLREERVSLTSATRLRQLQTQQMQTPSPGVVAGLWRGRR